MTFLANPCSCGWSMDDIDESTRKCERCGRTAVLKSGVWVISKPTEDVEQHQTSSVRRYLAYLEELEKKEKK